MNVTKLSRAEIRMEAQANKHFLFEITKSALFKQLAIHLDCQCTPILVIEGRSKLRQKFTENDLSIAAVLTGDLPSQYLSLNQCNNHYGEKLDRQNWNM